MEVWPFNSRLSTTQQLVHMWVTYSIWMECRLQLATRPCVTSEWHWVIHIIKVSRQHFPSLRRKWANLMSLKADTSPKWLSTTRWKPPACKASLLRRLPWALQSKTSKIIPLRTLASLWRYLRLLTLHLFTRVPAFQTLRTPAQN